MHIKTLSAWVLAGLLLAVPAGAVGWDFSPGDTGSRAGACTFKQTNICWADFTTDEETTDILDTRICENWTAHFDSRLLSEVHDNAVQVRWSMDGVVGVNTSAVVNNATLTGDPATGLDVLAGFDSPWLYVQMKTDAGGTARISIQCFARGRGIRS